MMQVEANGRNGWKAVIRERHWLDDDDMLIGEHGGGMSRNIVRLLTGLLFVAFGIDQLFIEAEHWPWGWAFLALGAIGVVLSLRDMKKQPTGA